MLVPEAKLKFAVKIKYVILALISQVQKPMCGIAQPCSMIVRNNVRIRRLLVPEPFLETSILTIHKAQFDTE